MDIPGGLGVAVGFLLAIVGHEYVQHRAAVALGDKTPRLMGRLTLSPKAHVDPVGTLILPAVFTVAAFFAASFGPMFGWGKRHSLNQRSLRNPKRDWIIVSLSGPAAALAIGTIAGRAAAVIEPHVGMIALGRAGALASFLYALALVAISIGVIELIPLPGRDGGRILGGFLSPAGQMKMEDLAQYEVLFLLVIFIFDPLRRVVLNIIGVFFDPLTGLGA